MPPHTDVTSRRSVLKLAGASLATLAGSGLASADHGHPDVTTQGYELITNTSVSFDGKLWNFGQGGSSAEVWFDWDHASSSGFLWQTDKETMTDTGTFTHYLWGLNEDTEYKFRAVAQANDGDFGYGDTYYFTTGSGSNQ